MFDTDFEQISDVFVGLILVTDHCGGKSLVGAVAGDLLTGS
ncbi:hypothetical protein AB0L63_04005 [Nocardia sp. NPDC051990]